MKLFSIKRIIGLGALYGAIQYARRHGGPRNALNELLGKAKNLAGQPAADRASDFASGTGAYGSAERTGYGTDDGSANRS